MYLRRFTFEGDLTAFQGENVVRTLCPGLLLVATTGLMLGCLGGLSGCDGKPADGTVIINPATPLTDEQKAEHRKFYPDRSKKARKGGGG
jgi:hypothetical protein